MYESLSILEQRQDELFDRIVRRLGEVASVDMNDAMIRGFLAEAAETLIGLRQDQSSEQAFVLENDPVLAELVTAYDDVGRAIAEHLGGETGAEWSSNRGLSEVADLAGSLGSSRDWSDDR